jgi:hypothetical protein
MRAISTLLSAIAFCATASAAIIIQSGPGNFPGDENILFNQAGLLASGPVVEGKTQSSGFVIEFKNAGEDLLTPAAGQARVEGADGGFTALTLMPGIPTVTFATLILNINANAAGDVQFTVVNSDGPPAIQTFTVASSGQNFFRFEGTAGTRMSSVSFLLTPNANTPTGTALAAADIRQVRIGGVGEVPEPATYVLTGLGIAVLGVFRKRKAPSA